jgi:predicted RNase H-like HicB family nuclease
MSAVHYTYRVTWSQEDEEYLGLCAELPSLSWLGGTPEKTLAGIRSLAAEALVDMESSGESIPVAAKVERGTLRG